VALSKNKKFVKEINIGMDRGNIVKSDISNDNPMDRNLYKKILNILKETTKEMDKVMI
jgi:hypothetical protein